ncbi:MAG: hypothetical protein ACFB2W_10955 [Leptolyngbyaceae cyanobacterium]
MKEAVYWLMGERGGEATLTVWNWLWGISEEVPNLEKDTCLDEDAIASAEAFLKVMQESVQQLAAHIEQQQTELQQVQQTYLRKATILKQAKKSVLRAERTGHQGDIATTTAYVAQLEELLIKLAAQIKQLENSISGYLSKLQQDQQSLETYKSNFLLLKQAKADNKTPSATAKSHSEQDAKSIRASLETVKNLVETRYLENQPRLDQSATSADKATINKTSTVQQ